MTNHANKAAKSSTPPSPSPSHSTQHPPEIDPRDIGVRVGPLLTEAQFKEYRRRAQNPQAIKILK